MIIRRMKKTDLEQIDHIEKASFVQPWSLSSFRAELNKPYAILLVAEEKEQIIGYVVAWEVANELHIANIAVKVENQCQGIATLFMAELEKIVADCDWMGLEVRESNKAAITLYKKLGFLQAGKRKNYYELEKEDAILMVKKIRKTAISH